MDDIRIWRGEKEPRAAQKIAPGQLEKWTMSVSKDLTMIQIQINIFLANIFV